MDDSTFEQWSAALLELRQARHDAIKLQIDERGKDYAAKDLFDHLMVSLDQIMSQWWDYERRSWESNPPSDGTLAIETLRNELDSVADFEIQASDEDIETAKGLIALKNNEIEKGHGDIQAFAADLKKNYTMKIDSLANSMKKAAAQQAPAATYSATARGSYSNSSGSSGLGMLVMFFLGLGLGSGLAYYFHVAAGKTEQSLTEDKDKLSNEKREIISEYTALQETYFQLARGKLLTLPELERIMKPIKEEAYAKKRAAEADFNRNKEGLFKRIPAGDRLDRSLAKLESDKQARLKEIEDSMNAKLEPYLKQQQIHEDLMKKQ